jgi:hypothetical protein
VTADELAAWGKASRAASGVPEKIEDPAVLARLVVLSDVEQASGGPVQPARRRRSRRSSPTAGIKRAQGDGP